ncbi:MAG: hypothetical protein NTX17_08025 [Candidatus Eisenbacteria bacterium]|nr:hypothetical protein [Candidatus Eisenbacteria bacterium]
MSADISKKIVLGIVVFLGGLLLWAILKRALLSLGNAWVGFIAGLLFWVGFAYLFSKATGWPFSHERKK